jgi:uncharacterized membrane protein
LQNEEAHHAAIMKTYLEHLSDMLRTSFWFVPAVFAFAALTLAFVMMWLDSMFNLQEFPLPVWLYAGDAQAARQLLTVMAVQ